MILSMYQVSVPPLLQILGSLSNILDKGVAFCAARSVEPVVLITYRLAPDMYPLSKQVQIVSDQAKGAAARLAGLEPPSFPDTETSFDELKARLAKTADYIKGFKPDQIDGSEEREIVLKGGGREVRFTGQRYILNFVLPNIYFHAATAYDILRHNGVELGKPDFIGSLPEFGA